MVAEKQKPKKDQNLCYGANLVLASLIEHELKQTVKLNYMKILLDNLHQKLSNGSEVLTHDESRIFNQLYRKFILGLDYDTPVDSVQLTTDLAIKLFDRHNILSSIRKLKDKEQELLKETISLNNLLKPRFTDFLNQDFVKFMRMIFSCSTLNLRNELAHCSYQNINSHHLYVTALLNEIFLMIANGMIL